MEQVKDRNKFKAVRYTDCTGEKLPGFSTLVLLILLGLLDQAANGEKVSPGGKWMDKCDRP